VIVQWTHRTPRTFTLLLWILALVMCFAVGVSGVAPGLREITPASADRYTFVQVMGLWQLWLISLGETAVESHDNEYYRKTAKALSRTFRNPYNLGRKANLREFFNVGEGG
jgi:palmitoyltransferase